MNSIETQGLATAEYKPFFYTRYIDDILCVWKDGPESMREFYQHMNSIDPSIKFTIETDEKSGWLSFLRFNLKSGDKCIERKVYRKPSTFPLFLSADSHHPEETKTNAILNQYRSIDKICNTECNYQEACNDLTNLLISNGYNLDFLNTLRIKSRSIYGYLHYVFKNNKSLHTENHPLSSFMKMRNLNIEYSKADGHCLLYSISSSTGIPTSTLINMIYSEFERNKDEYVASLIDMNEVDAKCQLDKYLLKKIYDLPIVDMMPLMLANCLGCNIFIFQEFCKKTTITLICINYFN